MAFLLFLNETDPSGIPQPFRGILIFLVIVAAIGIPLGLALWRLQSRTRTRILRIPFSDAQALIYQVTKVLAQVGYSQGATSGQTVRFEPGGPQKAFGAASIELLFDQPGSARLSAANQIMRRIAHIFPGATEEKYSGPSSIPWKGLGIAFSLLLVLMLILGGAAFMSSRSGTAAGIADSHHDLDVEQVLNVTAEQARRGALVEFKIAHTGMPFTVHLEKNTTEGAKLTFHGMGKMPPGGGVMGDFFVKIHIME